MCDWENRIKRLQQEKETTKTMLLFLQTSVDVKPGQLARGGGLARPSVGPSLTLSQ